MKMFNVIVAPIASPANSPICIFVAHELFSDFGRVFLA